MTGEERVPPARGEEKGIEVLRAYFNPDCVRPCVLTTVSRERNKCCGVKTLNVSKRNAPLTPCDPVTRTACLRRSSNPKRAKEKRRLIFTKLPVIPRVNMKR